MNDNISNMKEIISKLNNASVEYYKYDSPIMTDKEYDDLYDELTVLEDKTGIIMANSPTRKVQGYVLEGFKKVLHSKPMLSAAKTKNIQDIKEFIGDNSYYASYKLDGLTTCLRYENGEFVKAITRGNGIIGEDVTEACRFIPNVPMKIPYEQPLEVRGETVVSWPEFERINKTLTEPYSHPRNLAAGTLRNLNLDIVKERNLSFVVFECVSDIKWDDKYTMLDVLDDMGFETVKRCRRSVEDSVKKLTPERYDYPSDGIIFEIESRKISKSLGATEHHENCRMALKWADELYETTLRDIVWQTSKSGLINPVAVFDPVDLDGAMTTRATLHNVSYIEDLQLGIGDTIQVYRANMVIPKVHDNLTRSNTWKLPSKCPCCGSSVNLKTSNRSKMLYCTNTDCLSKIVGKLAHFCSRDAINIEGISEETLWLLVQRGWVKSFKDLYNLSEENIETLKYNTVGFGKKSTEKLINSIEKSRKTTLSRFIYSLSIPLVGKTAGKTIEDHCRSFEGLTSCYLTGFRWETLSGIGFEIATSLDDYFREHYEEIVELSKEFVFENNHDSQDDIVSTINGKIFVITGKVETFKNRNELKEKIEKAGGKVSGSVTNKTDYLINNDVTSKSSKNQTAKKLGVPIISEAEIVAMLKGE